MEPIRRHDKRNLEGLPVGKLGLIPVTGEEEMAKKIDRYLVHWRAERAREHKNNPAYNNYKSDSYIMEAQLPRFGTGEGKGVLPDSVRGMDLYILVDVVNFSKTDAGGEELPGATITIYDKDGNIIVKRNHMIRPARAERVVKYGVDENGDVYFYVEE